MDVSLLATPVPAAPPVHQLHNYALQARAAQVSRHFQVDVRGLPLNHIQGDCVPNTGEYGPYAHFHFRLHDGSSIVFFDPNGERREHPADSTYASQMEDASIDARARLDDWTARKAQWRQEHVQSQATGSVKPQLNDRPEASVRTASLQETRGTA